ncbi:hypothetical protein AMJ85_11265 [candidate division BRC1 bacterium SM23_51]|nr:MAG: hypothetical protein AMJ85_11265 [candidate division BRC1 bacterium SM23_51]
MRDFAMLSPLAPTVRNWVIVLSALSLSGVSATANGEATTETPPAAITLRPGVPGSPQYPLLPFDITIEVQNLTSEPQHSAAFLFDMDDPVKLDLGNWNRWWLWSPDGNGDQFCPWTIDLMRNRVSSPLP